MIISEASVAGVITVDLKLAVLNNGTFDTRHSTSDISINYRPSVAAWLVVTSVTRSTSRAASRGFWLSFGRTRNKEITLKWDFPPQERHV